MRAPYHTLSMDIFAAHHVLGLSILPDLATIRSCCNGLTVTFEPACERCQGESGSVKSPYHILSMDIFAAHHVVLGLSILPDLATIRPCCNGLIVTLDRRCVSRRDACQSNRSRGLCAAPLPYVKHGYRLSLPHTIRCWGYRYFPTSPPFAHAVTD